MAWFHASTKRKLVRVFLFETYSQRNLSIYHITFINPQLQHSVALTSTITELLSSITSLYPFPSNSINLTLHVYKVFYKLELFL